MISFELSEEQEIARSAASGLARSTLAPAARAADEAAQIPSSALNGAWALGIVQAVADPAFRTMEQPTVLNALVLEELAAGDATVAAAIAASVGFAKAVAEQGSDRQRAELLPPFVSDVPRFAAVVELDGPLADDTAANASVTRVADGFRLRGGATMVLLAKPSTHLLTLVKCDGRDEALIVPLDTDGVRVSKIHGTLGLRGLDWASVAFNGVTVPASMRLGETASANVQRIRDASRIALCAMLSGLSRAVFDFALPYSKTRIVHGEAIARKQAIAFKLADMHVAIDAMRWMGLKAAAELDRSPEAPRSARLAQLYASDAAMRIADEGVQVFGGHGFVRDLPLEMWYRNARSLSVLDGLVGA
ncbi:acyl-CoA dehydrogenase family protein [Bradyrhizobium diversitatis]|uniref:Acyl-CoA dehydrogenase n=1 Tax=Bradyrhizobium diversitatis TaxID=2755406 RepID=A0ABS0PCR3_9BRAD|nr:acyl-CoA dehydrogenase [Bradyrhizobium diversitatis]MBH5390827.1 acyl-CoA dehydrogenase [Bradyrhizobium diversitatis]